ncbi:MAG: hypothetical protein U0232_02125 [Thermomicrobiales bacterium]
MRWWRIRILTGSTAVRHWSTSWNSAARLYPLLIAGVFRLFGENIASLRGLTAAAGVGASRRSGSSRQFLGPRVALVAALLSARSVPGGSASTVWPSTPPRPRSAPSARSPPSSTAAAVRAGRRGLWQFALAGLLGGLAIYCYYPGRFALPVLAGAALVLIVRDRLTFLRRAALAGPDPRRPGRRADAGAARRYAVEQPTTSSSAPSRSSCSPIISWRG